MARQVFEIAQAFSDKVFNDVDKAFKFKERVRDSTLEDFQIPEKLSQTRLNDINNRFDATNRLNTFDTDLETNRINSDLKLRQSQFAQGNLSEEEYLNDVVRSNTISKELALQREYKYAAANIEQEEERVKTKYQADLMDERNRIVEAQNTFEKYNTDKEYNQVMAGMEDWESQPKGARAQFIWDRAKSLNVSKPTLDLIKLKIKEELADDITSLQAAEEHLMSINVYTKMLRKGTKLNPSQQFEFNVLQQKLTAIENSTAIDFMSLKFAMERGILPLSEMGSFANEIIISKTKDVPISNDGEPIDPAGQPVQPTNQQPAPQQTQQPAPVPSLDAGMDPNLPSEPPLPPIEESIVDTQTPDETAAETGSITSIISDLEQQYPENAAIVKGLSVQLGQSMLRDPSGVEEAKVFISEIDNRLDKLEEQVDMIKPEYIEILVQMAIERKAMLKYQFGVEGE